MKGELPRKSSLFSTRTCRSSPEVSGGCFCQYCWRLHRHFWVFYFHMIPRFWVRLFFVNNFDFSIIDGGGISLFITSAIWLFGHLICLFSFFGHQETANFCYYLFGKSQNKFNMPGPVVSWSTLMYPPLKSLTSSYHCFTGVSDFLHLWAWPTQTVCVGLPSVLLTGDEFVDASQYLSGTEVECVFYYKTSSLFHGLAQPQRAWATPSVSVDQG